MSNEKIIWDYLKSKGFTDAGVAGLMGNLYAESGLSPINLQNTGNTKLGMTDEQYTAAVDNGSYGNFIEDSQGYGLAQWTYWSRKKNLYNFAKSASKSIGDLCMQLDFLYQELSTEFYSVFSVLCNTNSVLEASNAVLLGFEKPADQSEAVQARRATYGQSYYDEYVSQNEVNNMDAVSRLLARAEGEVGYLEKASNSQLDSKTANAGRNNYTKYARDLDALGIVYNTKKNGYAWCDIFTDWNFITEFGLETAMKMLNQSYKGLGAGCEYSANYFKAAGRFYTSNPQPGDQIFFTDGTEMTHTGIVYAVDSKYVYTIEGNTSSSAGVVANGGAVAKKYYALNYSKIAGYGRPDWSLVQTYTEGWVKNEKGYWYRYSDGTWPASEWKDIDGTLYYFGADGYIVVNQIVEGTGSFTGFQFYCGSDGKVVTNTIITHNGIEYMADDYGRLTEIVAKPDVILPETEDEEMTQEQFEKMFDNMRGKLQDNDASNYSQEAREWAVSTGLVKGGSTEEFNGMWHDFLNREQFVTILYRYAKMIGMA